VSLYKRGNVWWSRIMWRSQIVQRSTKVKNRQAAVQIEAAWRTQLAKGEVGIYDHTQSPTVAEFRDRFQEYQPARVAPNTAARYADAYKLLVNYKPLADTRLFQVNQTLVDGFVQDRLAAGLMPGTVNNSLRTLRRALHLATEWGLLQKPPKIKLLPGERSREFVISDDMLNDFARHPLCSDGLMLLVWFLVDTGLRITEACDLSWENVSFLPKEGAQRGYVFVAKGKSKAARRYVPLTGRARAVLAERKKLSRGPWVFTGKDGKRKMSRYTIGEQFRAVRDALGWPWDASIHSCRHTFLTRLGESGCDVFTLQKLAGHSSAAMSGRYVHPTGPRLESAIGALEPVSEG
jgi:integrase